MSERRRGYCRILSGRGFLKPQTRCCVGTHSTKALWRSKSDTWYPARRAALDPQRPFAPIGSNAGPCPTANDLVAEDARGLSSDPWDRLSTLEGRAHRRMRLRKQLAELPVVVPQPSSICAGKRGVEL